MTPDDYLWDKSGKPDPEIEKLERSLASLAHRGEPLVLPRDVRGASPAAGRHGVGDILREWLRPRVMVPTFAAIAAMIAAVLWWQGARHSAWEVADVTGAPRVAGRTLAVKDRLARGERLETDARSGVRLKVGDIGFVDVGARSRVELVSARRRDQRLALGVGTLDAVILAPPRRFAVETPVVRAVDLGCAYTLEVGPDGETTVTVNAGWVSFETGGLESFVPAGARAITRPGSRPGTPCFTDADPRLKNALFVLDFGVAVPPFLEADSTVRRDSALHVAMAAARREDALTLWHLLARTTGDERGKVYDALAARVPAPDGVTREGILAGNARMLDAWWDALGFGDTKAWRKWRRPWGQVAVR